jgi:hypothetical protein
MKVGYSRVLEDVRLQAEACGRDSGEITLVAVSKSEPISSIKEAYQEGARQFGESRVQEAFQKIPHLPSDCRWHLIGSLQANKVAKALAAFHLIHSVDSLYLAQKIDQAGKRTGATASILIQVNTSGEKSKHGLSPEEWAKHLDRLSELSNLRIEGLMTMAPLTDDQEVVRSCFSTLRSLREHWRPFMREPSSFRHLSMGMSHDYPIAIQEGATILRIGTAIFQRC